jgi:hypothetical protein
VKSDRSASRFEQFMSPHIQGYGTDLLGAFLSAFLANLNFQRFKSRKQETWIENISSIFTADF